MPHRSLRSVARSACRLGLLGATFVVTSLATPRALAAVPPSVAAAPPAESGSAGGYWTPERRRNARPMPMPVPSAEGAATASDDDATAPQPVVGAPGAPPVVRPDGDDEGADATLDALAELLDEEAEEATQDASDLATTSADVPTSVGTSGCPFTSGRLNPRTIDVKYPYSAVGKLFVTQPGVGDFVCSGAVIQRRVVVTAGHCVHAGNGLPGTFFTNFSFCPAYRGGPSGKYGCWDFSYGVTTVEWATGGSTFPNAADFAMLVFQDRLINGVTTRLGDFTGFFGFLTGSLVSNHVHMLGYPVGFSQGERMHQVSSGRCTSGGNNSERYGSDMRGGSSGGPWVQDFGRVAAGQTVTSPQGANLIVGITSFSNVSTEPRYQGSSVPGQSFIDIFDNACAQDAVAPANCF